MKTKRTKRTLSLLLTFVMVLTIIPAMSSTAFAYEPPKVGFDYEHPLKCTDFNSFKAAMEDSSILFVKPTGQVEIPADASIANGAYINTVGEKVVVDTCYFSTSDDTQATSGDLINVGQNSTLSVEESINFDPDYDGASVITTPYSTSKLFVNAGVGLRGTGEYISSSTSDGYGIKADNGKVVINGGSVSGFEDSDIGIYCALRVGEADVDIYGGSLITYHIVDFYSFPTPAVRLAGEAGASKFHVYGNSDENTNIYNGFAWATGERDTDIDDIVIDSFSTAEYLSNVSVRPLNDRKASKLLRITRPEENDTHYFPLTVTGIDYYPYDAAQKGTVLELSAPDSVGDKAFDRWECISNIGSVNFADAYSPYTTFTMPGGEVEIKAVYKTKIFKSHSGSSLSKIGTTSLLNTTLEPSAYPSNNGVLSDENTIILQKQTGLTWTDVWSSSPSEWSSGNINATLPAENTAGRIIYRWHVMDVTGRWQDKMIYVDWSPLTVTYDMQGHGTQVPQASVSTVGYKTSEPQKPTAPGYVFNGWVDENNNKWIFNTNTVTQDITLYADWAEYGFFDNIPNGEGCIGYPITVSLANVNHPTTQAYLEEKVNGYWDKSHRILLSDSATSYTFSAQDENTVKTYRIAIKISESSDDDVYSNQFTVKWRNPIVSFNLRGHGTNFTQSVTMGGTAYRPTTPTAEGYTFSRWEYRNEQYDFSTSVTQDITLDAAWIEAGFTGDIPNYVGEIKSPVTVSLEKVRNPNHFTMKLEEMVDGEWQYKKTVSNAMLDIEDFEIDAEITKVTKTYRINIADMIYSNAFTVSWKEKAIPLNYVGPERDVPEGTIGYSISGFNLNPANIYVEGGVSPYTFSKFSGPDWINVSATGYVSGTRPGTPSAATTAVVRITDSVGTTLDITIDVGAVVSTLRVPAFSPSDGKTFLKSTMVIIDADFSAATYYTDDGSDPKTSATRALIPSTHYFTIDKSCTLKIYSEKDGFPDTPVVTASFVKINTPYAPEASVASSTVPGGTFVKLTGPTDNTKIAYTMTTDGTPPATPTATTGTIYDTFSSGILLNGYAGTVIKISAVAYSTSDNSIVSPVVSYTYVIASTQNCLLPVSAATAVGFSRKRVVTDIMASTDISDIVTPLAGYTLAVTPSYATGRSSFYGTGTVINLVYGTVTLDTYSLIIKGDVNGDSVCDVFDCMLTEQAMNDSSMLIDSYLLAADYNENESVDASDLQQVVNRALNK